ncbi:MAG: carboxypeptidase regulatory-like domain-containing protein [Bacteroidales bacterium]|nr:carboxypeptidase regulatory-like domain-containing protein [Bacteroidales bacterium]
MKRILSLLLVSMTLIVFNQSCKKPVEEQKGAINGYVTDKATGDYVENATVLLKPVNKTATTKSDGYFEFLELELGDYSLSASKDGYRDYEDNQTISVKGSDAISRDIEMEKLVSSMKVVDDDGDEISELNFGNLADDISRTFYILNDGEIPVNYQIEITSSWINIDATEGMLQPDSLERIVVTIDREKLSAGENLATVNVVSGDNSVELIVKAYKSINIITLEPSDITTNSAILKGSINIENKSFAERGFILYIDEATSTKYVVSGNDMGEYSHQVMNLGDGQTYRYEAYMICNDETIYGGEITFTTEQIPDPESPIVTTADVTDITQTTAVSGGNVTDDGGAAVTARGVCWSTSQNPTISDNHTSDGNGTGSFTSNLTNLTANTTYYVRAYATNENGTSYGEQKSFTTLQNIELPTVTTADVTDITQTTAVSGGNVTDDGGAAVTARGVCWSKDPNPTIDNSFISNGNGTGSFTIEISGLTSATTYYIRAYATNSEGTSYGEQKSFTTLQYIQLPTVTTTIVTNVTSTTATSGGNVTDDGGATVTARGVCWSTSPDPTIDDNKTTDGNGTGAFTSQLTNLTHSTTYYIRAYATNSEGTSYGEQKYFSTLSDGMINGHQYVDLGLSSGLKWATCNVGADSPEDYGNYYAWGETETKAEYTQDNSVTFGQQLNDISGNAQYDAATANWGGSWRMPTKDEIRELIYNCNWTPETQNGVDGFKVTGNNGNYIFIPASGYRDGSSLYIYGECYYWSSTPRQYGVEFANILYSDTEFQSEDVNYRYRGLTIRPVSN